MLILRYFERKTDIRILTWKAKIINSKSQKLIDKINVYASNHMQKLTHYTLNWKNKT